MSQHYFETTCKGKHITVLVGWDYGAQGFFMVIEDEEYEVIWSNLLHAKNPFPKTLEPFLKVLEKIHITMPQPMIHEVIQDSIDNIDDHKMIAHAIENGQYIRW